MSKATEVQKFREDAAAHPLFASLDPEPRATLLDSGEVVPYRARTTILREGMAPDFVYFLLRGAVRVFHRRDEQEIVVKLFRAPALFGEMEVLAEIPFLEWVTTLERCYVLQVRANVFKRAVKTQPKFAAAIAKDVALRLCVATVNERALVFDRIGSRLAALLCDYADICGVTSEQGVRLELPLSQEQLAADLGASRRAVVLALDALRDEQLVEKRDGRYVVRDKKALLERASRVLGLAYRIV